VDFDINRDSQQSMGLLVWLPLGVNRPMGTRHVDRVRGLSFTEAGTPIWMVDAERGWSLLFDDVAEEYLTHAAAVLSGVPFTLTCRFNCDQLPSVSGATQDLIAITDASTDDDWFRLLLSITDVVKALTKAGGVAASAATTDTATVNTWHYAAFVSDATDSRVAYLDRDKGTNNTDLTPANLDTTSIGAVWADFGVGSEARFAFSGRMQDIRFYNRALSDAENDEIYRNPWELYRPRVQMWPGYVAAVGPTVALDALGLTGVAQTLTVSPGAVQIALDLLSLGGAAQALAVSPGAVQVALDTLGLVSTPGSLTVVPGAVQIALDALSITGTARGTSILAGAVSIALDALALAASVEPLTVTSGVSVALDVLGLTGAARSLSVLPGAVAVELDALNLVAALLAVTLAAEAGLIDVKVSDALLWGVTVHDGLLGRVTASDALVGDVALSDESRT